MKGASIEMTRHSRSPLDVGRPWHFSGQPSWTSLWSDKVCFGGIDDQTALPDDGKLTGLRGNRYKTRKMPDHAHTQDLTMTDQKKKTDLTPIKGILTQVLRECRGSFQQDPDLLGQIWDRAVGAAIARNAQPAAFKQRLLVVHVSSSVWLQELFFQKSALIERVNAVAGREILEDIRFKIGPLAKP